MQFYINIFLIVINVIIFSFSQAPFIIFSYLNTKKILEKKNKFYYTRSSVISLVMAIVSVYNIGLIIAGGSSSFLQINIEYLTLLFGVVLVCTTGISAFSIIETFLSKFNSTNKKQNIKNISVALLFIVVILLIFIMTVVEDFLDLNQLLQAANIYYPLIFIVAGIVGLVSMLIVGKEKISLNSYAIAIICFIPLGIIDIWFLVDINIQTISIVICYFCFVVVDDMLTHNLKLETKKDMISFYEFSERYDLTERESEVLLLAIKGLTNNDIGVKLFISTNTVKNHMQKLFTKLNVKNRYQLVDVVSKVTLPK